jgi:hypothetical protein
VSVASLEAKLVELRACIRDMEKLDDWLDGLGRIVAAKADRFSGVSAKGSWTGDAADEFEQELKRSRTQVSETRAHAGQASSVVGREIALKKAEIVMVEAQLVAARLFEAAQRAAAAAAAAKESG